MGLFRRDKTTLLDNTAYLELKVIFQLIQEENARVQVDSSKQNYEKLFNSADKFARHYSNNLPSNFMLQLNHESLSSYKQVQSWIYEVESIREWALGAYIVAIFGEANSSSNEAQDMFARVTANMSPINGNLPRLTNALFANGIR